MTTAAEPAPVVEARGLHRFFRRGGDEVAAVRDVSFVVGHGELIAVRGPSGSGKSTLLALLAGVDRPDAGEVRLDGEVINFRDAPDPATARRRTIGVLTQAGGLIEHLSVRDNLRVAARARRSTDDVDALLDLVGLGHRATAVPSQLSGGETARAGLAVALIGSPRLLLADEPTAEVSATEEQSLLELLTNVRPSDGATIVVTHSDAVAGAAQRILDLSAGRLVA
ncbi:MAG: putative transport system ATP-binding protein [Frankiaceae bacterium]|nr:putative transport system ATP-binding protein [Frankiaceae bacterium]